MNIPNVWTGSQPVAYIDRQEIPHDIFDDLIQLADLEGDLKVAFYRETIEQMAGQNFWWTEGEAEEPGETTGNRRDWHLFFQSLLKNTNDAELVFVQF